MQFFGTTILGSRIVWHAIRFASKFRKIQTENSPFAFTLIVIRLADLKAKPVANQENAHPMQDWSCRICNQHAPYDPRGTGFKPDTPARITRDRTSLI